jgi:thioester reductase-like protein
MTGRSIQTQDFAPSTWPELLRERAIRLGDKLALRFLQSGEQETDRLSYAGLDRRARALAVRLREECASGDRVVLIYPAGLEFLTAFFGCLYAGVVAVPVYPPKSNESPDRLLSILSDAGARLALTNRPMGKTLEPFRSAFESGGVRLLATDDVDLAQADEWVFPAIRSDTLAFLQYTSGSTGRPKGVMLTHGNLLANQDMMWRLHGLREETVMGGWLPLYHDMGLIGTALHTIYTGGSFVLMPPAAFLQNPLRWLRLLSKYRVTSTAAPNFAYDLCVERTTIADRAQLDLSSLRCATNGAEPIRAETLKRFAEAFAPCGLRPDVLVPCYGLAEASLLVSGSMPSGVLAVEQFDPGQLRTGNAVPVQGPEARSLASSGRIAAGLTVQIVNPESRDVLPEGRVGEIWVHGPSIGLGYWNQPEMSRETFRAQTNGGTEPRYLRTGDLGFLLRGELFIAGRIKDLIIVRGRNLYPQDLELAAQSAHPALQAHGAAAFAIESTEGRESFAVVVEVKRTALRTLDADAITAAIRQAIVRDHEVSPAVILLVKPATLPRTSSGKMRRLFCREQFREEKLATVGEWRADGRSSSHGTGPPPAALVANDVTGAKLQQWLIERVAAALNVALESVDPHAPLQSLGLDSMAAVTLAGELEAYLGRPVAPTVVYDFPTIQLLAQNLASPARADEASRSTNAKDSLADKANQEDDRAIAIVGMSCRFPGGANDPEAFWAMLRAGKDAVGEIPRERWDVDACFDPNPETPGRMYVRHGAFLDAVDGFDPDFFGVAPREAVAMDPQHRLLLELAWEALERAAIPPAKLAGTACGVFVGLSFDDYARLSAPAGSADAINPYSALGGARSLAAARISYHLGLQGPSLVADTLCSSSLLAVHLAMQSLRTGECRVALAGGANLILAPETTIASCKLKALAPDGRCKTFDAAADGYGRGEGAGLVVLKRLRDAIADGDPVLAVLEGSAVNHDGRSNGLTAPNALAQESLIRSALADAGVAAKEVSFVETHGTGTVLGDPIEVQALARVYGEGRPAGAALLLGAVKTNVGHLEAAAGMAGLLKTVLALQHGEIPANLHFRTPNPYIPWGTLPLNVVSRTTPWPMSGRRIAGVSSFGLSGTNVHLVVGAPPDRNPPRRPAWERPRHVFTVSGQMTSAALDCARAWATRIEAEDTSVSDLCFTANAGRNALAFRRAVVAASRDDLSARLRSLTLEDFVTAGTSAPVVGFLFPGRDSAYAGMARELHENHPGFRATIEYCEKRFAATLPEALTSVLFGAPRGRIEPPLHALPALFAVEVALGRMWLEWGVRPAGVFGHDVGEYAAGCVAGVFSLEDGARLVAARMRLEQSSGDAALDEFRAVASSIVYQKPAIPIVTSREDGVAETEIATPDYWIRQVREPVDVAPGVRALVQTPGCTAFIEVGPRTSLVSRGQKALSRESARSRLWLPSLRPGRSDWQVSLDTLATLYHNGVDIDWVGFERGYVRRRRGGGPTYPFQRRRYWIETASARTVETVPAVAPAAAPAASDILVRLRRADVTQRDRVLEDFLQLELNRVLGRGETDRFDPKQGFFALGMDSLMAVELADRLETELGVKLPTTIAFDRATLGALHAELKRLLFPGADEAPVRTEPVPKPLPEGEPIAIVGIGCRFPGGVTSPDEFWAMLRDGRQGIGPVPGDRWDAAAYFHPDPAQAGSIYVREFGFIEGVDRFDHGFFNLYPREAVSMDPQQRIVLETAWEALESAGLANERLRGSATGVFVGVSTNDYASLLMKSGDAARIDAYFGTGNALNAIAGRLAYVLGLRGPTLVTDSACSSSLVALHQACQSLRAGECRQAIVVGVNLMLAPEPVIALCRARMLAPDGRCKTFAADANGYGRGEGCGVVVIKPLAEARAAGDTVLAVASGSAVNQDGASSGFTVPSGAAQKELIERALATAGRTADDLDYVEAHGTGTPLGDPIELNAIGGVLGQDRRRPLFVGSVKTNVGHLESAAGIAGVIKTALALHHGAIPSHLNFSRPTPQFAWDASPLQVPTQLTPWPSRGAVPRVAGVSSFGFTGTNAHVILESASAPSSAPATAKTLQLIPLSARTPEALAALRSRVLSWLSGQADLRIADVANTFGCGRLHHEVREAYVVESVDEWRAQLAARSGASGGRADVRASTFAFICTTSDAADLGRAWQRWGLKPDAVLGEGEGLVPAAVLAGIFSPEDGKRLAADSAVIASVSLNSPKMSFGLRYSGRIADERASSREWWRATLASQDSAATSASSTEREFVLTPMDERARLARAAELYVAGFELEWSQITPRAGARHLFTAPTYAFQRSRHWLDLAPTDASSPTQRFGCDALLGERIPLPGSNEVRFAARHSARSPAFLEHHRLFGQVIAPAAQHISMMLAGARAGRWSETGTISDLRFPEAVRLQPEETRAVQLVLGPEESGKVRVRVLSEPKNADADWTVHAEGSITRSVAAALPAFDIGRTAAEPEINGTELYRVLGDAGYVLGTSFRWVQSLRRSDGVLRGVLAAPADTADIGSYAMHPGLLDACFQLLGWGAGLREGALNREAIYIPASIEAVRYFRVPSHQRLIAEVRVTETDAGRTHRVRGDIRLMEEDGTLVVEVEGFEARRAAREWLLGGAKPSPSARYHRVTWVEVPRPAAATPSIGRVWNVLGESGIARALVDRLRAGGQRVEHHSVPTSDVTEVVLFCDEQAAPDDATATQSARLLTLVQTLVVLAHQPRVWVVTRGAQAMERDHGPVPIGAAAAVGLARIAALEHPELRLGLIDLDPDIPADEATALAEQLLAPDDENQIALRGPRRLAARLVTDQPAPFPAAAVRLGVRSYADLDTLELRPAARVAPRAGEVEIEVRAAGLNFRDVLNAMGVLESHLEKLGVGAATQLPLGGECAGVISAVGTRVKHLRPGDAVVAAFAPGSLGSHVTADVRFVVPKPERLPWTQAATLPIVYVTAHYALRKMAGLRAGERVLIHSAAGGVGLAAIHVARMLGAEVCATASLAKWPVLQELGVTQLGFSRSTDYAGAFAPVDVVLNSLTGDHIPRSLELLAPGGRFIEIGKIGIWSAEQVAAKRPDVEYQVFDLVEMARSSPDVIQEILQELSVEWSAGRLPPLPWRSYPLTAAADAFRFMAQARHVGKLVLVRPSGTPPRPGREGVYVVTGGLGGIGLAVTEWLVRAGAGTIVLAGRRAPSMEQAGALQQLCAAGGRVVWHPADFAHAGAAARLINGAAAEFGPVRGVFHAAGVLDDGLLDQQTPARLASVYAPKASAAWELHEATLGQPLDYFVLFSSLASVIGSPGQSTYAAANAALDALAVHRQRLGLPALSINWGPWGHAGMAARLDDRQRARLAAAGLRPFTKAEGLEIFGELLLSSTPQVTAAQLDAAALSASFGGHVPPLFRLLGTGSTTSDLKHQAWQSELRALPPHERLEHITRELGLRFAELLGLAGGERLPRDRSLTALGFDSLMIVELKSWVASALHLEIPTQEIAGFSIDALARRILAETFEPVANRPSAPDGDVEPRLRHDAELPDDVRPSGVPPRTTDVRAVLLTGATGFLGAFLLHELLSATDASVHCLVRARTAEEGLRRVLDNLRSYGLDAGPDAGRIVIVPGDLAQPRLGLDEAAFEVLAGAVDAIYHNGAWLNFFYTYDALRPVNVLGTLDVLRLAAHGVPKPVHYVSTSGVFYSRHYRGRAMAESDPADQCNGHAIGYSQSKWVAERLVRAAGARGLPTTIYRAPFITGDSERGAWNADDFICRLVRGVVAMGALPELAASMDIVPVNYVARGMVRLARERESAGGCFHLCGGGEVPWPALAGWLAENGYPVRREAYATWIGRLPDLRGKNHPLEPFFPLFLEKAAPDRPTVPEVFLQSAHSRLDDAATAARLAAMGIARPTIDSALWRTYLTSLAAAGLLPSPATSPSP